MDVLIRVFFILVVLVILFLLVILPRLRKLRGTEQEEPSIESPVTETFCLSCGKANPVDHAFCSYCGTELNTNRSGEEK